MNEGLKTTFEELSKTENEAAASVLVSAIDSPHEDIRDGTLRAILARRSQTGQRELVRRLHTMDQRWRAIINENRGRMTSALRDAILDPDPQMCANGCQGILWFAEYDLIPTLIGALEDEANPHADLAAETLLDLCALLYDELAGPRDYKNRRDPQRVRRHVTTALEQSLKRYYKHKKLEPVEAFLILATRDNATLKRILLDPFHGSYLTVVDALTGSKRPGIMRLLLSYLDDSQPPSSALNTLVHRSDFRFVRHLLKKIGYRPSDAAASNLKRIESIVWLKDDFPLLDRLDDAGQHSAVQLAVRSGMKRTDVFRVVAHLLNHGKTKGRRAAAVALAEFNGTEANALALEAMEDEDPHVQAAALSQIRQRGIAGALPMLIEKVDSPHQVIRHAAQESLTEFSFKRFLAAYDMLDEDVRRSTGLLVKKIDPQTIPQLQEQLASKSRTRRLRALSLVAAIDAVPELETEVIRVLDDRDHLVRVEAVRALAGGKSATAWAALEGALEDSSGAVREAAQASMETIRAASDHQEQISSVESRQESADE